MVHKSHLLDVVTTQALLTKWEHYIENHLNLIKQELIRRALIDEPTSQLLETSRCRFSNTDKRVEGAITVVVKGEPEDGDAIFQSAKIALAGARTQAHSIIFPSDNKQAEAAKRLLIHLSATGGTFTKEDVDGFCNDVGLAASNNANVRQFLERSICNAAGLPASGENKAKVFAHDFTTKKYSTAISVTTVSTE